MGDAGNGPVGPEDECLGALVDAVAEEFGKAQVVADGGADAQGLLADPLVEFDLVACCI